MSSIQTTQNQVITPVSNPSQNTQIPPDLQEDLTLLENNLKDLNQNPKLAEDPRFQDEMNMILTDYCNDYNALGSNDRKSFEQLNLDLMEGGLINDHDGGTDPISAALGQHGDSADTLNDLINSPSGVDWVTDRIDPAIDTLLGNS